MQKVQRKGGKEGTIIKNRQGVAETDFHTKWDYQCYAVPPIYTAVIATGHVKHKGFMITGCGYLNVKGEAPAKVPDKSRLFRRPSSQRLKIKGICHCERSAAI